MAGRGMGAATQGGGCVEKGGKKTVKNTSQTTGPVMMNRGGMVLPAQANARAGEAMAARRGMPTQAAGARPFKKGGSVKKYQAGGMALPSQAAARAGEAMAARRAMPTQAMGARPFKKGGMAKKTKKGSSCK